jgi:hypothetical protein
MRGHDHSANQVISQWSTFDEALTFVRRWEDKLEPTSVRDVGPLSLLPLPLNRQFFTL